MLSRSKTGNNPASRVNYYTFTYHVNIYRRIYNVLIPFLNH